MSIIQKLVKVVNADDENGAKEIIHDDLNLMHDLKKLCLKTM